MKLPVNRTPYPRELIGHANDWLRSGQRVALVTLTHIEGNAPYPIGSQMLVSETGGFVGQITGGCAETAIADQAVAAIKAGHNQRQRYGLDSPFFDIKLPCGSGIDVYFDCTMTLDSIGELNRKLTARESVLTHIDGIEKTYLPSARLQVVGQGPILVSLASLALASGFDVICVAQNDDTLALIEQAGLVGSGPDGFPHIAHGCDEFTALISLFHEHELEVSILQAALDTHAFYLGALGSRRTHKARCQILSEAGVAEAQIERIHGPVGIDIGARTPAQIAVAILADVIAEMNKSASV